MKNHTVEMIIQKRIKNNHIVNVVQKMVYAHKYVKKTIVIQKFMHEYYNFNNKTNSDTITIILNAFKISCNDQHTKAILNNSFYRACKLTNIVLMVGFKKQQLIDTKQNVRLRIFLVKDSQICEECYNKSRDKEDSGIPDIESECLIDPEQSYFFCCSYICECCYTNKLYTKM
ncbi:hypothetical protein [Psilogramma increta granulovirus]|uniref:Uncharacterized protein n=1 Tax=Psilogramma increta granulovirus TaxID=2953508 RepID=A0A977TNY5_9BBAC|nr:hypothetical protein [Psilogramma increta granulovirus]